MNEKNICKKVKAASYELLKLNSAQKNNVLKDLAFLIRKKKDAIKKENSKDIREAKKNKLKASLIDRLLLDDKRIDSMAAGVEEVIKLDDPVGEVVEMKIRPNGLKIGKQRVPLGVVMIIYESRPNVTIDAGILCFKSSNACFLKGGKEAKYSNKILVDLFKEALRKNKVNHNCVYCLTDISRKQVLEFLKMDEYIDVVIPRGGEGLIRAVAANSSIPVIKHYKGVCHTYVSNKAHLPTAAKIVYNAKIQRPGVCNAMETLLIHKKVSEKFILTVARGLLMAGVKLRCCNSSYKLLKKNKIECRQAKESDWYEEYLDLILSIKIVSSTEEAIEHINKYGSHHSDAIVTKDYNEAENFLNSVDSAAVYVNASTRFTDGFEFGLGAEIGISTDKIHARGPMGLKELTSLKFIIHGQGQIRT